MPKTQWKPYFGIVFGRHDNRFRGLHQGYSIHEDRREQVRYCMNIGAELLNIHTRTGSFRRNQVDGEIHEVAVLPSQKALAVSGKVFVTSPNELWDYRYRYSQFEHTEYDPQTWSDLDASTWEELIPSNTF